MAGEDGDVSDAANLRQWLAEVIAKAGPIPVETFMRHCLLHERFGYYRSKPAIGAAGDFITAPEISQVFGELAGIWTAAAWVALGEPKRWRLIELGPGRGTLMADLLRALKVLPAARAGVEVVLVEANALLAEQQRAALAPRGVPVRWHEDATALAGLQRLPTVLIANEFLDALPIRQQVAVGGRWHERCVVIDSGDTPTFYTTPHPVPLSVGEGQGEGWSFALHPAAGETCDARDGVIREIMSGSRALLAGLAKLPAPAYHLFIDYGHVGPVLGDTLQAVQNHRYVDPLSTAGDADLSAQVDFTQVATAAIACGLEAYGPITQAEFLGRLGAAERLERLTRDKDAATVLAMQTALARLMQPDGMGGRFKALALATKGLAKPPLF